MMHHICGVFNQHNFDNGRLRTTHISSLLYHEYPHISRDLDHEPTKQIAYVGALTCSLSMSFWSTLSDPRCGDAMESLSPRSRRGPGTGVDDQC
jgi:hypothetical protein